jgi:lipopolysaccharide/colanic/teichoic acid biosynthesis glycosyltransferase
MTNTSFIRPARELLFVGFDQQTTDDFLVNFPENSAIYGIEVINQPFKALLWLESRVHSIQAYQPPFAVFFHQDFLKKDQFAMIQQLQQHPDLRFVPFIALTENGRQADHALLQKNGIDDCYEMPVRWKMIESRLEFLNTFKPRLLEKQQNTFNPEKFVVHLPKWKRALDIFGASAIILALSPIFVATAIAVKLESGGNIIYRQKRAGRGYQVFDFLKFRSMYPDADRRLAELKSLNQYGDGKFFKISNDPRVTKVGKFIRKYSIDELPQLFNILKGDMSLVGNRPLPLYEAEVLTNDEFSERFLGPAGLTGLWQVTKRGQKDMSDEERISLDITYARQFSSLMDAKILVKTLTAFKQAENV